jgi:hypothetical protein
MMKRILLASALGGLTVFVWGFLSWAVLPWHRATLKSIPDEAPLIEQMQQRLPASGVYLFPAEPQDPNAAVQNEYTERFRRGPIGYIFYRMPGVDGMDPAVMLLGLLFFCLSALIAASLLSTTSAVITTYSARVFFVALLGVFTALESHVNTWNWLQYPGQFSLVNTLDVIAAWLLGGIVIAAIVRPPKVLPGLSDTATPSA